MSADLPAGNAAGKTFSTLNRAARRSLGFRGPAYELSAPTLTRFTRRHPPTGVLATRRQRKQFARIRRAFVRRGIQ